MKQKLFILAAGFILTSSSATSVFAQGGGSSAISPAVRAVKATDGEYNYKTFTVDVPEEGVYYTEFWLQPARYANNQYTTFKVYVNNEYAGDITPTYGNWQSARVDKSDMLYLSKGRNTIKVGTLAPEFPNVETLKVAKTDSEAEISSAAYDDYLARAEKGFVTEEVSEASNISGDVAELNAFKNHSNIPLKYTHYLMYKMNEDDNILISTASSLNHVVDIFFYGVPTSFSSNSGVSVASTNDTPVIYYPDVKYTLSCTPATSFEMQTLTKAQKSTKTSSSSYTTLFNFEAPKTGLYFIRVHAADNGKVGTVNFNINNQYYYDNAPISYNYATQDIPADGKTYAAMTCSHTFGVDDPLMFIEGGMDGMSVVGFNDDAPVAKRNEYNLSKWDSYFAQQYFVKAKRISVNNYSSSNPESKCNIFFDEASSANSVSPMMIRQQETAGLTNAKSEDLNNVDFNTVVEQGGNISFHSNEIINKVEVYSLSGSKVGTLNCGEESMTVAAGKLNMTQSGWYLISVETAAGVTTKKVCVK